VEPYLHTVHHAQIQRLGASSSLRRHDFPAHATDTQHAFVVSVSYRIRGNWDTHANSPSVCSERRQ